MLGSLDGLLPIILVVGAIVSAIGIAVAHTGTQRHLVVFAILAWLALVIATWVVFPTRISHTEVGRVLACLLVPAPSVVLATIAIAGTQWRPIPINPRASLVGAAFAFVLGSPFGIMAGIWSSSAFPK